MASCMPAFGEYLEAWIRGESGAFEDDVESGTLDADDVVGYGGDALRALHVQWQGMVRDSDDPKLRHLTSLLQGLRGEGVQRVLVFSTYRRILDYLGGSLRDAGYGDEQLLRLDGRVPMDEREGIFKRFRQARDFTVLLTSEVAGEGLDFQFCNTLVNYDLPWNPMRVEQRIGRIDRFGQESPVIHIYNYKTPGTIEDRVFFRLFDRIRLFEQAIGDLEGILGEEIAAINSLTNDIFRQKLTPQEEERRIEQVALNIERNQQQRAKYETHQPELFAHDDYFTDQVRRMREQGRFVGPDDLEMLVRCALGSGDFPGVRMHARAAGTQTCELSFSTDARRKDFREQIRLALQVLDAKVNPRVRSRFLARLESNQPLVLTFDPQTSGDDGELEFIAVHHPLLQALVSIGAKALEAGTCACLQLPRHSKVLVPTGDYAFFFFSLHFSGFQTREEWFPLVVNGAGKLVELYADGWWNLLRSGLLRSWPRDEPLPASSVMEHAFDVAQHEATSERERRKSKMSARAADLVDRRLAAIKGHFQRRINRVEEDLARAGSSTNPQWLRLQEGKVRKAEERRTDARRELELRRTVNVGHSMVACGVVRVVQREAEKSRPTKTKARRKASD